MRNGPSAKKKKSTIRQMKKIHYNFEKKSFYGCEKNRPIMVLLQNESVLLFFYLLVHSRKKRLSVRLQKSTKTHLTDKKPKSKRKG